MSNMTSPIPGPNTDDDALKMRLLLPHLALAGLLLLLAIVSFIHYHWTNKESKADAKFTEELKTTLRRPRAGQGFPSTLISYFGLEALNRESFDFTKYLTEKAAIRETEYQHALKQLQLIQQQEQGMQPKQQEQQQQHVLQQQQQQQQLLMQQQLQLQQQQWPPQGFGVRPIGGIGSSTQPVHGQQYITHVSETNGHDNFNFLYDEEFKDYNPGRGLTLTPTCLEDDDSPASYRDAGSFTTHTSFPKSEPSTSRGKIRVSLKPMSRS